MGFHHVVLNEDVSYDFAGGNFREVSMVQTKGGEDYRVARWAEDKGRWNAAYLIQDRQTAYNLLAFLRARKGTSNGFLWKPWEDYATTVDGSTTHGNSVAFDDVVIGTGTGSLSTFQLVKTYTSGSETETRTIRKPKASTVKIGVDGVEQVSPGWTYPWSVDDTTGIVTFTVDPPAGEAVTWGGEFYAAVLFEPDVRDALMTIIRSFNDEDIPDLGVVEMNNDVQTPDLYYHGAATRQTIIADTVYAYSMGALVRLTVDTAGLKFIMPKTADLPDGDQHIAIINNAASTESIQLYDNETSTVIVSALAAGKSAEMYLYRPGGVATWEAVGAA